MLAFRAAVEVGAHAVETDLHLSKDGVVVLSHDATLKRCFGFDAKVRDCDWSYLSTLRTLQEPAESLPRLKDLLEYLNEGALEHVWIMLDIKVCICIGFDERKGKGKPPGRTPSGKAGRPVLGIRRWPWPS